MVAIFGADQIQAAPPLQLAAPSQGMIGPAFDCQMIVWLQS